jgi:hypothetical protein
MMTDSAREVVETYQSKLQYPLKTMEWENHWWGHRFNPLEKYHEVVYPKGVSIEKLDSNRKLLNYLHELIHAYYSETIHPLFGGFDFDYDYPGEVVAVVSEAYRVACDWFIWDKVVELVPEAGREEIDVAFEDYMNNYNPEIHVRYEQVYVFGLVLALACKYLELPLRDESDQDDDAEGEDVIVKLAEVFISIEPAEPTIEKLEELINRLLALGYSYRVKSSGFIHYPTLVITGI